jgi:hypothetical protein
MGEKKQSLLGAAMYQEPGTYIVGILLDGSRFHYPVIGDPKITAESARKRT